MHAALAGLSNNDLSAIQPQIDQTDGHVYTTVDFNQNSDEIELANAASLLIANVASLKDHLKAWCKKQGVPFNNGDILIDSNMSVALIHDLWNVDKHAEELNSPPRSGFKPKLQNIKTVLAISSGTAAGGSAFFSMDPRTKKVTTGTSGGGTVQLALDAQITDELGNNLGDFAQTARKQLKHGQALSVQPEYHCRDAQPSTLGFITINP
jgi:hypothetical protein